MDGPLLQIIYDDFTNKPIANTMKTNNMDFFFFHIFALQNVFTYLSIVHN